MRILVVGGSGMLGTDTVRVLRERGHEVDAPPGSNLDITSWSDVRTEVSGYGAVINCAAHTAVDTAETEEGRAYEINALGPQYLARACAQSDCLLVHVSTDYVFDGEAASPYGENHPLSPASAYGRTKAAGEWAVAAARGRHHILRTAWLYGSGGACFPKTMARLARERTELSVVDDQVGQPTWARDVAVLIADMLAVEAPSGIYHATSGGQTSWFGFTREIVASLGLDPGMVKPTDSASFRRPAPRPAYSVLGHDAFSDLDGVEPIGHWLTRWREAAPEVLGI